MMREYATNAAKQRSSQTEQYQTPKSKSAKRSERAVIKDLLMSS
jgi:hypothetical protein